MEATGLLETSKSQPEHTGHSACLTPVGDTGALGRSSNKWFRGTLKVPYFIWGRIELSNFQGTSSLTLRVLCGYR